MTKPTQAQSKPVVSILPDQLTPVIGELCEVSNLSEFLCTFIMRVQDSQEDHVSLSFGESETLISLMQSVAERLVATTAKLTDISLGLGKEETSHD
ncbi:MAG TPA: hypothetical protein VHB01_13520 [Nitrosospira sp.]|nr:hypothetical protein [Nitrosospira sp.]